MTPQPKPNPGFADRLITLLTQADMRPKDLATMIDPPLEVVEAYLKGKIPEAEVLYRLEKAPENRDPRIKAINWLDIGEPDYYD